MNANEIVRALYLCAAGGQTELQTAEWCTKAADLIKSLQAQLADYHHMSKLVDGKMGENQRLRRINENLQERLAASQRRESAAVELIDEIRSDATGDWSFIMFKIDNWRGPQESGEGGTP